MGGFKWQKLNQLTDVRIVSIVKCGQQTIEKRIAHCIMNKVFTQIGVFHQNVLVTLLENINFINTIKIFCNRTKHFCYTEIWKVLHNPEILRKNPERSLRLCDF